MFEIPWKFCQQNRLYWKMEECIFTGINIVNMFRLLSFTNFQHLQYSACISKKFPWAKQIEVMVDWNIKSSVQKSYCLCCCLEIKHGIFFWGWNFGLLDFWLAKNCKVKSQYHELDDTLRVEQINSSGYFIL